MAKSLASQSTGTELAKVGDFNLQTMFGASSAVQIVPKMNTPYLVFAQPAAKDQWMDLMRKFPDIEDGDPVLFFPEPTPPIRPNPLRMTILAATQYFATRDQGKGGGEKDRFSRPGAGRVERIFAACIIYLPDRAVVATCKFKSVKCAAAAKISAEIEACQKPDWIKNGAAHEMAVAACATPHARVVATVSVSGRTGKSSGMGYRVTNAQLSPSGPTEWKLLSQVSPEEMAAVAEVYKNALAELNIQ